LNYANHNKYFGDDSPLNIGSTTHNISTSGHPPALNQLTTARESFVSQHISPKKINKGLDESHPPHWQLNRIKYRKEMACTHPLCDHAILLLYFKFYLI